MKLLVAVDGSPNALRAVEAAIALLGRVSEADNRLDLVSVHDPQALHYAVGVIGEQRIEKFLADASAQDLEAARERVAAAGLASESLVERGPVAPTIGAIATRGAYDMLVLGTKGRSNVRDFLMGSVAQRIGATTAVPVLLVR
ncbi:MAG: universal stress protein [Burkholderiaceae bacterium]